MEPDHSSSVRALRMLYPDIQIVGNAKTLQMLQGFYGIDTGTLEVKEGDSISLGSKTLSFYMAPMVHWPETMVTWCAEAGTLFSGDAFGTFGAIDGGITDSQIDPSRYWDEMRRYYACIVGKYGGPVQKALAKVRGLNPTTICSTHGPVWQREIPQVMDVYDRLSRYEGEPGVVIAYGSMYGNTEQMAERIARELAAEGVGPIFVHNMSYADESIVLRDVFRYDTLIVGGLTYNGGLYPPVARLLDLIAARCVPQRNFGWFGYQCTFFGSSITSMFKLAAGIEVNLTACIVIGGLLMMITAIVGYKGIKVLSQFGVPLLFLLVIGGVIKTFTVVPAGEIVSAPPVEPISFATAVSLMGGSFIVGVSIVQDFTRYSKTVKDSSIGIVLGFTIGYRSSDLRCNLCLRLPVQ